MKKLFAICAVSAFLLAACGDDSSSASSDESVEFDTLTDIRDGQTYKTVRIGGHWWMAENLKFEIDRHSICYGKSADNCSVYGRLYAWSAAMDSMGVYSKKSIYCGMGETCKVRTPARGVCPEGWHIPTGDEWKNLFAAMKNSPHAMQAKGFDEWPDATDAFGFAALPAGYDFYGHSLHLDTVGYFWSASEIDVNNAYSWQLRADEASLTGKNVTKEESFSVRCAKDEPGSSTDSSGSQTKFCDVKKDKNCIEDDRDNATYKTVKIGSQTWMAENANFEAYGSRCYRDSASYCEKYGRLYTWAAIKRACPSGWHLPTKAEFETLVEFVGGGSVAAKKLKSTSGWPEGANGTDDYSFSALNAGYLYYDIGPKILRYRDDEVCFWSSTEEEDKQYAYRMFWEPNSAYAWVSFGDKHEACSVRCIQDDK